MKPPINAEQRRTELDALTEKIIGCAFAVGNILGCGFLEKVYENAMAQEFRKHGIHFAQQYPIRIRYDNVIVGDYTADLLAEGKVLIELKAAKDFDEIHLAQCLNYLKATGFSVCLLINFGKPKVEVKRIVNNF